MKTKIVDIKIFDESERDIYHRWVHFLGKYRKLAKDRRKAAARIKVPERALIDDYEDLYQAA
jgi:hypothetical protein